MSEWVVRVVQVGAVSKHPNADSLSIVDVEGYPCIIRTGDFHEGDKAVYVPVDSIVPTEPRWEFLDNRRIKAKRLRGVFSMGLLSQADPSWSVGDVVHEALGITKHDPDVREGIVVKPVRERVSRSLGRVLLKLAGQGYLLRKCA